MREGPQRRIPARDRHIGQILPGRQPPDQRPGQGALADRQIPARHPTAEDEAGAGRAAAEDHVARPASRQRPGKGLPFDSCFPTKPFHISLAPR